MKKCTKCGELKPLDEFYKDNRKGDGLRYDCKVCNIKSVKKYHKTKNGLITLIYGNQIKHSTIKWNCSPTYSRKELKEWLYSQKLFHELYDDWVNSGYLKDLSPSCDRLDDYQGYSLCNIQLMTWKDNRRKGHDDILNGINNKQSKAVISLNPVTGEQIEYYSMRQAERETGIKNGGISNCCLDKNKSAGGFYWRFKNGK